MVELQPSKLVTRVRFPSPAPEDLSTKESQPWFFLFQQDRENRTDEVEFREEHVPVARF